jgi:hypothetical protein
MRENRKKWLSLPALSDTKHKTYLDLFDLFLKDCESGVFQIGTLRLAANFDETNGTKT